MREVSAADLEKFPAAWHAQAFLPALVVRRHGTLKWSLSLGSVGDACVMVWPLLQSGLGDKMIFSVAHAESDTFSWLHIDDIANFEAVPVEWWGPAHTRYCADKPVGPSSSASSSSAAPGGMLYGFTHHGVIARQAGDVSSVLKAAAKCGFRGLSVTMLRTMFTDLGYGVAAAESSTLKVVGKGIDEILGKQSAVDMMAIMTKRQQLSMVDDDFWNTEEALEALPTKDAKFITAHADSCGSTAVFNKELSEKKEELGTELAEKKKMTSKKAVGKAKPRAGTRTCSVKDMPNEISRDEARLYSPEGWTIYKRGWDNRWTIVHKCLPPMSRCWTLHGEVTALAMVLKHAWAWHTKLKREECPFPWIADMA